MADIAWIELHKLNDTRSDVQSVAVNESDVSTFETWVPPRPDDFRIPLGIQSAVRLIDGSFLYVTETFDQIATLVKMKRR